MMSWKIRIGIIVVLVIGLIILANMIRKRSLELKYALVWLFVEAALIVVVLIPGILDVISGLLGVYDPMNMVFFLGFLFSIVIILVLTITASKQSDRVRQLAQKMALNEYKTRQ